MMWCIHSFFQKPCFFGYQMKSLFAYQSGCKKAASSLTSRQGTRIPTSNCLVRCQTVWQNVTLFHQAELLKMGFLKLGNRRFSTKKIETKEWNSWWIFWLSFFFSASYSKLPAKCHVFVGPVQVIVRASKQRMAGNVPMATLEKQRSFVCLQAGGSSHGNWRVHH